MGPILLPTRGFSCWARLAKFNIVLTARSIICQSPIFIRKREKIKKRKRRIVIYQYFNFYRLKAAANVILRMRYTTRNYKHTCKSLGPFLWSRRKWWKFEISSFSKWNFEFSRLMKTVGNIAWAHHCHPDPGSKPLATKKQKKHNRPWKSFWNLLFFETFLLANFLRKFKIELSGFESGSASWDI